MSRLKINSAQQGFTLIEVMVSLLIISIGMLGVAGMQTRDLQSGSLAAQRLIVVMKAQDIAGRIRINSASVDSYAVSESYAGINNLCVNETKCTAQQLAEFDVYLWKQDLLTVLPNNADTTASVTVDNPAPATTLATVVITISWKNSAGDQSYSTSFQVDSTNTVTDS